MTRIAPRPLTSSFDRIAIPSLWIVLVLALLVVALTIFREPPSVSDPVSGEIVPLRPIDLTPATRSPRL